MAKSNAAQPEQEMSSGSAYPIPDSTKAVVREKLLTALASLDFLQFLLRNGWIPAERELPDSDKTVLVYATDGPPVGVWLAYYLVETEEWRYVNGSDAEVTHWMPLPEPPEDA